MDSTSTSLESSLMPWSSFLLGRLDWVCSKIQGWYKIVGNSPRVYTIQAVQKYMCMAAWAYTMALKATLNERQMGCICCDTHPLVLDLTILNNQVQNHL